LNDENINEHNDENLYQVKISEEGYNHNNPLVGIGGQLIDLNQPYNYENMNEHNDEDISQVKNANEGFSHNFDLNF